MTTTTAIHPEATHHLPFFITPPGETDILMNVMIVKNASVADIVRIYLEQAKGESITYHRQEQGWAVYSGYQGGLIYYLKVILSPGTDGKPVCWN